MINSPERLAKLLPRLDAAAWIALDTEADSLHAYPEKLCLLQISSPGSDVLVDPLAGMDLNDLWNTLRNRRLILHGADYDLRLLNKWHRFAPHSLFDTMIASRLTGCVRFGLSDLVEQFLGVKLEKGPQKADWARRPLSDRMIEYALNDSRYLHPLSEILEQKLRETGRLPWAEETCARLIADCSKPPPYDEDSVWRVKGSFRLQPRALAVLRELWRCREREAIAANRPPFFILSHEIMVALADAAVHGSPVADLLPQRMSPRRKATLEEAIEHGLSVPSADWPRLHRSTPYHPTVAEKNRFEELKRHRDQQAADLKIDPTLISNRSTLELIARNGGEIPGDLMNWQRKLLGV